MCLHDEVPLDFQVVCESIKRESAAFAKLVPLNSDGVQEWCQRQSGKRKRPGPAASCEAPAPEVLAISETSSTCRASLQQHSQVPDTLPDPRLLQGDPILTGPSGVIDVKGKFWPLMQLYEPLTWRKWCGAQFPEMMRKSQVSLTYWDPSVHCSRLPSSSLGGIGSRARLLIRENHSGSRPMA